MNHIAYEFCSSCELGNTYHKCMNDVDEFDYNVYCSCELTYENITNKFTESTNANYAFWNHIHDHHVCFCELGYNLVN